MKPDQIRKLLGGYATGTLTEQERKALFDAALDDQQLFDALADEEALRELLSDEAYRQELAVLLSEKKSSVSERLTAWWRRPAPLVWAGGLAAVLAVVIVYQVNKPAIPVQEIAMSKAPAPAIASPEKKTATATLTEDTAPPTEPEITQSNTPAQASIDTESKEEAVTELERTTPPTEADVLQAVPLEAARQRAPKPPPVVAPQLAEELEGLAFAEHETGEPMAGQQLARGIQPPPAPTGGGGGGSVSPPRAKATAYRQLAVGEISTEAKLKAAALQKGNLQFTIEIENPDGTYIAAPQSQVFSQEDRIRFSVAPSGAGRLYLVDVTAASSPRVLSSVIVNEDMRSTIPAEGALPPPGESGQRRLRLVYSPQALSADRLGGMLVSDKDVTEAGAAGSDTASGSINSVEMVLTYR